MANPLIIISKDIVWDLVSKKMGITSDKNVTFDDLWIRQKNPRLGPIRFVPNATQVKYLDDICPNWREGDYECTGVRDIILKFRQPGFSTLIGALIFCNTYNMQGIESLLIAQDEASSEILFRMHRLFYDRLPDNKKRPVGSHSSRELHFTDINSRISCRTAGATNVGRGNTIHWLHMSERAKWKLKSHALMEFDAGVMEAVPSDGNIMMETTADGLGHFYDSYQAAKSGSSTFRPMFFPWTIHNEYSLPVDVPFELTKDELELRGTIGLTDGQILWRRQKVKERGDLFAQEYPVNDEECFRRSVDNAYFPTQYLMDLYMKQCKVQPVQVIKVSDAFPGYSGTLNLWELPDWRYEYIAGADVSEGIFEDKDHDYSVLDIFRRDNLKHVGCFYGRLDPTQFADVCDWVCRQYNNALLGVERNNHGHATIARLDSGGLSYPNLYEHKVNRLRFGENEEDTVIGFPTTSTTKVIRNDKLATMLMEARDGYDSIQLSDPRVISECLRYIKLPHGKASGDGSAHDDHVTSVSICAYLADLYGRGVEYYEPSDSSPVILYG